MAGALLPADPPHAYVVEYRPLDRCFPPACRFGSRAVYGYASAVMDDGNPGAYVRQGVSGENEHFFERGVLLSTGESFTIDLPPATHGSELDVVLASAQGDSDYDAEVTVSEQTNAAPPRRLTESRHRGHTGPFEKPTAATIGRFEKLGTHLRLPLPDRAHRGLHITIANRARAGLAVGAPLVMRRVEGRGPRQGLVVIHDAVAFHEAAAFLFDGTHDPKADWVQQTVHERGVYFPAGQSPGQATHHFGIRFATGGYYRGVGWPGMFGQGLDESVLPAVPGPIARAGEQGFVTAFFGNNLGLLPAFANAGWDLGFNSEMREHPLALVRLVEAWASERPHDDAVIVWWNAQTHAPHGPGRTGSPAPEPKNAGKGWSAERVDGTWRNLLQAADRLQIAMDTLRKASPHASRVTWLGSDHSSAVSAKMTERSYRNSTHTGTFLLHGAGATAEEANTPFAIVYDDPDHRRPAPPPQVVMERTSQLVGWRAFESFLGLAFDLPRTSTFETKLYPDPLAPPVWDDRILVSIGSANAMRATRGDTSYSVFTPNLTLLPAWTVPAAEQLLLTGGPHRVPGASEEELFEDRTDPYELENLAATHHADTLRMRREMADWLATHWEDHHHRRHRSLLVFAESMDVDLFAPRPFTALVGEVPVASTDGRLAHVQGRDVAILEGAEPVGIIELRGVKTPLVLKCSANGLPLDVLTPDRPRFNLEVARSNCPLPAGPRDLAGPGEVLFSFEPAAVRAVAPAGPGAAGVSTSIGGNQEFLDGMKRWGYVRDLGDNGKR